MNQRGATLIEVLAVIGMVTILMGIGVGALSAGRTRTEFSKDAEKVADLVKETQSMARTSVQGLHWGIECSGAALTQVGFTNAGIRDSEQPVALPDTMSCTLSTATVTFAKLTGMPDTDAQLHLTRGSAQATISIAHPGTVILSL